MKSRGCEYVIGEISKKNEKYSISAGLPILKEFEGDWKIAKISEMELKQKKERVRKGEKERSRIGDERDDR